VLDAPIGPTIARMTVPVILGILAILTFNLVDTFFIGLIGTRELAAVSFTFPVCFVVMNVAMGIAAATTSVSAHLLGQNQRSRAGSLNTHALWLSAAVILPLSLLGILTINPLFLALGAPEDLLPLIREFMLPWYGGVVLLALPMTAHGSIRATGDTRTPALVMGKAALINGLLDPVFIFALGWGISGAAWATVLSWAYASLAALRALHGTGLMRLTALPEQPWQRSSRTLIHLSWPAAITNLLGPLSAAVITLMTARYGHEAVAAFGVGTRIESLALVVTMGLGSALAPFIGQNLGAGHHDRILAALRLSLRFSIVWGLGMSLLLWLASDPIARLFSEDPQVQASLAAFLHLVPMGFAGAGTFMVVVSALNALRRPLPGTLLNAGRLFGVVLPAAWLGSDLSGLEGLYAGLALANLLTGLGAALWLMRGMQRGGWLPAAGANAL
jgi:putative MATE family efflux protein